MRRQEIVVEVQLFEKSNSKQGIGETKFDQLSQLEWEGRLQRLGRMAETRRGLDVRLEVYGEKPARVIVAGGAINEAMKLLINASVLYVRRSRLLRKECGEVCRVEE